MRLPVGDPARAWLRPAGSDAADTARLTEWRNRFVRAFLTEFEATEERTSHWLKESVAPDETRILFMLDLPDGGTVGYLGLAFIDWESGRGEADAVVRVKIIRYEVNSPNYRTGAGGQRAEVLQRQVTITAQVQIVDQVNNEIYWEAPTLRAEGQFLETTETEEVGRAEAIRTLVQGIVDGAQSNW